MYTNTALAHSWCSPVNRLYFFPGCALIQRIFLFFILEPFLFIRFFSSREKISKEALFLVESSNYRAFMHTHLHEKVKTHHGWARRFLSSVCYYSLVIDRHRISLDEAIVQHTNHKHSRWTILKGKGNTESRVHDMRLLIWFNLKVFFVSLWKLSWNRISSDGEVRKHEPNDFKLFTTRRRKTDSRRCDIETK